MHHYSPHGTDRCVSRSWLSFEGRTKRLSTSGFRAGMAKVLTLCPEAMTPSHLWITCQGHEIKEKKTNLTSM